MPARVNEGVTHREQLDHPTSLLAHLAAAHGRREGSWPERLVRGEVTVDGEVARGDRLLRPGQWLEWSQPPWEEPQAPLDFEVLYEDAHLLAVAKPSGLPTLPGAGFHQHTLLWQVQRRFAPAAPAHRLGRGTSGVVLFTRTPKAAAAVQRAWGGALKLYRALVSGSVDWAERTLDFEIGPVPHPVLGTVHGATPEGRSAKSVARVLERRAGATLVEVRIFTGRPHQVRIHLAAAGHPLVGDLLYAPGGLPRPDSRAVPGDCGYLLHAGHLELPHPATGAPLTLAAPPPKELEPAG